MTLTRRGRRAAAAAVAILGVIAGFTTHNRPMAGVVLIASYFLFVAALATADYAGALPQWAPSDEEDIYNPPPYAGRHRIEAPTCATCQAREVASEQSRECIDCLTELTRWHGELAGTSLTELNMAMHADPDRLRTMTTPPNN